MRNALFRQGKIKKLIENLFDLSNNIANIRLYEVWQIR